MNKATLSRRVAAELDLTICEVQPVVNALFEQMTEALLDGEKIAISSLGTFSLKESPARNGYDPASTSVRYAVSPSQQRRLREHCGKTEK